MQIRCSTDVVSRCSVDPATPWEIIWLVCIQTPLCREKEKRLPRSEKTPNSDTHWATVIDEAQNWMKCNDPYVKFGLVLLKCTTISICIGLMQWIYKYSLLVGIIFIPLQLVGLAGINQIPVYGQVMNYPTPSDEYKFKTTIWPTLILSHIKSQRII